MSQTRTVPSVGLPLVVGFVTVLLQLLIFDRAVTLMDEGHILQFADLLRRGGELYRDATLLPLPGAFYLLAGLYSAFEPSILVARWAVVLEFGVLVACVVGVLQRSLSKQGIAFVVLLLWIYRIWCFPHWQMYGYSTTALTLIAVAWAAIVRHLEADSRRALLFAGVIAGLATACKQDYGGAAILAFNLTLALGALRGGELGWRRFGIFNAAAASIGLVVLGHYLRVGLAEEMLRQTVLNHLVGIATFEYSSLPPIFPVFAQEPLLRGPYGLAVYVPPLLATLHWNEILQSAWYQETFLWDWALKAFFWGPYFYVAGTLAWIYARRRRLFDPEFRPIALRETSLALLAAALIFSLHKPKDWVHVVVVYWPLICLLGLQADAWRRSHTGIPGWVRWATGIFLVLATGTTVALAIELRLQHDTPLRASRAQVYVKAEEGPVLDRAVDYVRKHTAPGETMAILPYFPLIHFLSERDAPHRSTYILWPVEEVPGREDEIIEALEADGAPPVLHHFTQWTQFPRMEAFAPTLYAYLVERYAIDEVITAKHWGYTLAGLTRDDTPIQGREILDTQLTRARVLIEHPGGRRQHITGADAADMAAARVWPFRPVLALRPQVAPQQAVLSVSARPAAGDHLETAIAVHPNDWVQLPPVWVRFAVRVVEDGRVHELFSRTLDPSRHASDRGWFPVSLDLSAYAGREIQLEFLTGAETTSGDTPPDSAFAWPRIVGPNSAALGSEPDAVASSVAP